MSTSGKNQLHSVSPEESSQDQRKLWQSAYAGMDFLGTKAFLVLLALRNDPTNRIYATLEVGGLGVKIDIPLRDPTPKEELRQRVSLQPTLWGGVDPGGYREATDTST